MNAQQAPCALRHSCAVSDVKSASRNSQSSMASTAMTSSHATSTVSSVFSGEENRFSLSQATGLAGACGAGDALAGVALMSSLHQRNALVVPVHENRDRQADREVGRHDDENALDCLARLIQCGVQIGRA